MKPRDSTRLAQDKEEKWLYKDLTENDEAQLLNYLKATKKRIGLLLNFGQKSLSIKRRIL